MRKKKEIIENTDTDVVLEIKKELRPQIPDVEVAKKLVNIHSSAQSRNLDFDLTFEYVKNLLEYSTCFYTNVTFTEDGPNARSFDRVDNDRGYVIGNVVACTTDINGKKNNLTIDEIVCLYKKLGNLIYLVSRSKVRIHSLGRLCSLAPNKQKSPYQSYGFKLSSKYFGSVAI
jgi:hypothetical protein